jgi:Protein of unknown function (DUF1344)
MRRGSVAAGALALVACVGSASAGERRGTVQEVDKTDRVIRLEDGTKLWLAEGLIIRQLPVGVTVKLSYEERDGKHVVTRIEAAE